MTASQASRIHGLGKLIAQANKAGQAPVEKWDPPYCGDIGLQIDGRGGWHYQNSPISRLALVQVFARVLRCEKNGKHYLVTPVEKVDVAVVDAPFLAEEMQIDDTGAGQVLTFRTNVDDVVAAGPEHPILFREEEKTGGLKPYVRIRGRLYARLTQALYIELAELAMELASDDDEQLKIYSGGQPFIFEHSDDRVFFDIET